jgi:hypothetical protein
MSNGRGDYNTCLPALTQIMEDKKMGIKKYYRSRDGQHIFNFEFINSGSHIKIHCNDHPSLNGRDSDPVKTHLYHSGKICFVEGQEPNSQSRAENLAGQWAEYFLNYIKTGETAQ